MKKIKTNIFKVVNCNRGDEFYIKVSNNKSPKLTDAKFKELIFDEFCWDDADGREWKNDVLVERVELIDW